MNTHPSATPVRTRCEPATIDLRGSAFQQDPHHVLRALRNQGPLHRDSLGMWLVTGHAEARQLLTDTRFGRDPRRWRGYASLRPYVADSTLEQVVERWMLFNDAPAHARLRRLAGAAFTPAAIRQLEVEVDATAAALVRELPRQHPFDLIGAFAQLFPVRVISDLLGLPAADFARSKAWSDALAMVVEPAASRQLRTASDRAAGEMLAYLRDIVARRRARPQDRLLDQMLLAQDASGSSDDELLANLMLLFVAGHETTTHLIGNGLLCLLRHPDQMARLRAEPALAVHAVEEMLRYESSVTVVARVVHAPHEIAGHVLEPGELVYCMVAAANRDPAVFDRPDDFDIGRDPNPHLSFGGGVHYCLGAPLARLEGRTALRHLLARFPALRLAESAPRWRGLVNLRGLAELQVCAD